MNSLNSVLLEGYLVGEPVESRTALNVIECTFTVASERNYRKDDETIKELTNVSIKVSSTIAESCLKHLQIGRGVRVVGRLKQIECNEKTQLIIQAEHVEFKPVVVPGNEDLEKAV